MGLSGRLGDGGRGDVWRDDDQVGCSGQRGMEKAFSSKALSSRMLLRRIGLTRPATRSPALHPQDAFQIARTRTGLYLVFDSGRFQAAERSARRETSFVVPSLPRPRSPQMRIPADPVPIRVSDNQRQPTSSLRAGDAELLLKSVRVQVPGLRIAGPPKDAPQDPRHIVTGAARGHTFFGKASRATLAIAKVK